MVQGFNHAPLPHTNLRIIPKTYCTCKQVIIKFRLRSFDWKASSEKTFRERGVNGRNIIKWILEIKCFGAVSKTGLAIKKSACEQGQKFCKREFIEQQSYYFYVKRSVSRLISYLVSQFFVTMAISFQMVENQMSLCSRQHADVCRSLSSEMEIRMGQTLSSHRVIYHIQHILDRRNILRLSP